MWAAITWFYEEINVINVDMCINLGFDKSISNNQDPILNIINN